MAAIFTITGFADEIAADLVAATRDEFADLLGARGEPVVARVRQWARGLPQYTTGHPDRIAVLRTADEMVRTLLDIKA